MVHVAGVGIRYIRMGLLPEDDHLVGAEVPQQVHLPVIGITVEGHLLELGEVHRQILVIFVGRQTRIEESIQTAEYLAEQKPIYKGRSSVCHLKIYSQI